MDFCSVINKLTYRHDIMALQKIDKEYCLTDDSVNVYGYRCLTEGFKVERFKPAIGLLMHNRERGVAVKWEDLRFDGDKLFAKPVINTTAFPDLAQQIEDGFYDGASCGKIVALAWSDEPEMKLAGQTGITVTEWFPREISIVDIPGNYNALANLYDEADNVLMDLSDNKQVFNNNQNQNEMPELNLTADQKKLLDLKDDATTEHVGVVLTDLVDKAKRTDKAEKDLADLKAETTGKEVEAILTQGMTDRKLTKDLADKLRVTYKENPTGLKDLVDGMHAQVIVSGEGDDTIPEKYAGKSFNDLYVSGDLADVKKNYPEFYKTLKNQ
jgi:hypothetical protein